MYKRQIAYGQTVLARAAFAAGIGWDPNEAHSAVYDAQQTARLFCAIANQWPRLPPTKAAEPAAIAATPDAID